jgi:AcrR family transcriptional regulator
MRLPASERKAQILKIATELFSELGYEGTKTSLIAHEARVNEAIIFRHFTNKEELYWAVLENTCCTIDSDNRLESILALDRPPYEALCELATELLIRAKKNPQMIRLLLFAALEHHKLSQRFFRKFTATRYEQLADYIRAQAKSGVFRVDVDPLLAARGFMGMLIYHHQIQQLFGGETVHAYEPETVASEFVTMWLQGMRVAVHPLENSARQPRWQPVEEVAVGAAQHA